jgi:hypothetical protein
MDFNAIMQAVSTVGFPIVCCGVLFHQNSKLSETINELNKTLVENTTILKQLSNDILRKKED